MILSEVLFILQAYRQDCETFAAVVKMLIRYAQVLSYYFLLAFKDRKVEHMAPILASYLCLCFISSCSLSSPSASFPYKICVLSFPYWTI